MAKTTSRLRALVSRPFAGKAKGIPFESNWPHSFQFPFDILWTHTLLELRPFAFLLKEGCESCDFIRNPGVRYRFFAALGERGPVKRRLSEISGGHSSEDLNKGKPPKKKAKNVLVFSTDDFTKALRETLPKEGKWSLLKHEIFCHLADVTSLQNV